MTFAFFLNSYNDIDNIVPVIFEFLERDEQLIIIFGTDYDYKNDYRIKYLKQNYNFKIFDFPAEYKQISIRTAFRQLKYLLGIYNNYEFFLKDNKISLCIFEWKVYYSSNIQNMFFGAAKNLKIPTIALPHGVSIYTNCVVTERDCELYKKTGKIQQVPFFYEADLYVDPNVQTQKLHICAGGDPSKMEVWGSSRYHSKWAKINLEICPKFTAKKSTEGKIKVVIMLPHWEYNVDVSKVISLINDLADLTWVYSAIKDHTRGNGGLNDDFRNELNSLPNVEASVSMDSPALIDWSDVVINFGSSIGIEAILQKKILINPSYLHTNHTIFEKTKSAFEPSDNSEVIEILKKTKSNTIKPISIKNEKYLLKEAVYGGKDEYDILEYYWKNISTLESRIRINKDSTDYHITKVYQSFVNRLQLKTPVLRMLIKDPINAIIYITRWILRTYLNRG